MEEKDTFKIRPVVISADDFERAKHATVMHLNPRVFKGKLPPVVYMIEEDKAMVYGVENTITFRKRLSNKTVTRSLQTIILDNSDRMFEKVTVYLNEDIG